MEPEAPAKPKKSLVKRMVRKVKKMGKAVRKSIGRKSTGGQSDASLGESTPGDIQRVGSDGALLGPAQMSRTLSETGSRMPGMFWRRSIDGGQGTGRGRAQQSGREAGNWEEKAVPVDEHKLGMTRSLGGRSSPEEGPDDDMPKAADKRPEPELDGKRQLSGSGSAASLEALQRAESAEGTLDDDDDIDYEDDDVGDDTELPTVEEEEELLSDTGPLKVMAVMEAAGEVTCGKSADFSEDEEDDAGEDVGNTFEQDAADSKDVHLPIDPQLVENVTEKIMPGKEDQQEATGVDLQDNVEVVESKGAATDETGDDAGGDDSTTIEQELADSKDVCEPIDPQLAKNVTEKIMPGKEDQQEANGVRLQGNAEILESKGGVIDETGDGAGEEDGTTIEQELADSKDAHQPIGPQLAQNVTEKILPGKEDQQEANGVNLRDSAEILESKGGVIDEAGDDAGEEDSTTIEQELADSKDAHQPIGPQLAENAAEKILPGKEDQQEANGVNLQDNAEILESKGGVIDETGDGAGEEDGTTIEQELADSKDVCRPIDPQLAKNVTEKIMPGKEDQQEDANVCTPDAADPLEGEVCVTNEEDGDAGEEDSTTIEQEEAHSKAICQSLEPDHAESGTEKDLTELGQEHADELIQDNTHVNDILEDMEVMDGQVASRTMRDLDISDIEEMKMQEQSLSQLDDLGKSIGEGGIVCSSAEEQCMQDQSKAHKRQRKLPWARIAVAPVTVAAYVVLVSLIKH